MFFVKGTATMQSKKQIDSSQLLGFRIDARAALAKRTAESVKLGLKKGDKMTSPLKKSR